MAGVSFQDSLDEGVHRIVSRAIYDQIKLTGVQMGQAAEACGMDVSMFSRRLASRSRWRINDIYSLAFFFDIPLSDLFPPRHLVRDLYVGPTLKPEVQPPPGSGTPGTAKP